MMTAYFEHESLPTLQAACRYVTEGNLNPKWKITITAHEMSPGVAVVRHPSRQAVMADGAELPISRAGLARLNEVLDGRG